MLMWKIVERSKASVLYIYIDYQIWFVNQKHCLHNVILLKKGQCIYDKSTQEIKEVA